MEKEDAIRLENRLVELAFDKKYGRLISLRNKRTGTQMIDEPLLAENFRILVPIPPNPPKTLYQTTYNYIRGKTQPLSDWRIEQRNGKTVLRLIWKEVTSEQSKSDIDISLIASIKEDSEDIIFRMCIENKSQLVVEEAWYPIISGFKGVSDPKATVAVFPDFKIDNIYDNFPDLGHYAYDVPWFFLSYPPGSAWGQGASRAISMPWFDLSDGKEGLYVVQHDKSCQVTTFVFEKYPPISRRIGSHQIPKDVPSGILMSVAKFPFIDPGATWRSPPVIVSLHAGDWHWGADKYRQWALSWMKVLERADWLKYWNGWQATQLNRPSGRTTFKFKDLPKLHRIARRYGIDTINPIGIQRWGTIGEPDLSPDPKLGTHEELKNAIEKVHEEEGKVILAYATVDQASTHTAWYTEELHRYAVRNRDGQEIRVRWGYDTIGHTKQEGLCTHMCTWVKRWQDIQIQQIMKWVELGADGVQLDQLGVDGLLCFDETHGHSKASEALPKGTLELVDRLRSTTKKANPDFVISGENLWDALALQFIDFQFCRLYEENDFVGRVWKYTFPEFLRMVMVCNYDFCQVNRALMLSYPFDVEMSRVLGTLDDEPRVSKYIKQVIKLRKDLMDYLVKGCFRDTLDARVDGDVRYTVYKGPRGYAVVLCNWSSSESKRAKVTFEKLPNEVDVTVYRPGQEPKKTITGQPVEIMVKRARVVVVVADTK